MRLLTAFAKAAGMVGTASLVAALAFWAGETLGPSLLVLAGVLVAITTGLAMFFYLEDRAAA